MKITNPIAMDNIKFEFPDLSEKEYQFLFENAEEIMTALRCAQMAQMSKGDTSFTDIASTIMDRAEKAAEDVDFAQSIFAPIVKEMLGKNYVFEKIVYGSYNSVKIHGQDWFRGEVYNSGVFIMTLEDNESIEDAFERTIAEKKASDNQKVQTALKRQNEEKIKKLNELANELGVRIVQ